VISRDCAEKIELNETTQVSQFTPQIDFWAQTANRLGWKGPEPDFRPSNEIALALRQVWTSYIEKFEGIWYQALFHKYQQAQIQNQNQQNMQNQQPASQIQQQQQQIPQQQLQQGQGQGDNQVRRNVLPSTTFLDAVAMGNNGNYNNLTPDQRQLIEATRRKTMDQGVSQSTPDDKPNIGQMQNQPIQPGFQTRFDPMASLQKVKAAEASVPSRFGMSIRNCGREFLR